MSHKDTKITVVGDGGWGTTLSLLLAGKGFRPLLWGAFPDYVAQTRKKRENVKFLPGLHIPESITLTSDLSEALSSEVIVLAVPSQYLGSVLSKLPKSGTLKKTFVIVTKGIETKSLRTVSQVARKYLGQAPVAVLSGPNIAREVAMRMPAAAVVASKSPAVAKRVREIFTTDRFNVFESSDVLGVELGGSLKNVIAIGAGIVEGLGLGSNTRALLFARGVAEMARLGQAMGAKRETFMGLSGLGDLATTCLSTHSRNRTFGCQIGQGQKIDVLLKGTEMVVEGVETAKAAHRLAKKHHVPMPISHAVYRILFEGQKPGLAVDALLHRGLARETD